MKKFLTISVFALFTMLMILPTSVFASTSDYSNHDHQAESTEVLMDGEIIVVPFYIPCPQGGKHTMYEHGAGEVRVNGKEWVPFGVVHQCSKCLEVIVSEYDPNDKGKLGKYGVEQLSYRLQVHYVMQNPDYTGTNTSTRVQPWIGSYTWY